MIERAQAAAAVFSAMSLNHQARFWQERVKSETRAADRASRQTQLTDWSRSNPMTLGVVQERHQRAKDKGGSQPALSKEAHEAAGAQSIPAIHAIRSTQSELRALLNGLGDAPTGAAGQQRRQVQAQLAILEKVERMADRRPVDKQVQAAFRRFDANHSGRIDYRELRSALALLGVDSSTENAQKMLQRYDKNASGLLDVHEFNDLLGDIRGETTREVRGEARAESRDHVRDEVQPYREARGFQPPPPLSLIMSGRDRGHHGGHGSRRPSSGRRDAARRGGFPVAPPTPPRGSKRDDKGAGAEAPDGWRARTDHPLPRPRSAHHRSRQAPNGSLDGPRLGQRHASRRDGVLFVDDSLRR